MTEEYGMKHIGHESSAGMSSAEREGRDRRNCKARSLRKRVNKLVSSSNSSIDVHFVVP